ncbi:MAG: VanW family protein [Nitriliruptoraceae bacterium]
MTPRRAATLAGLSLGGLLVVAVTAMSVLVIVQQGRVMPNTFLVGIEVSRTNVDELTAIVQDVERERRDESVTFVFEEREFVIAPRDVDHEVDVDATVDVVMSRGRSGFPGAAVERVRALWTRSDLDLVQTVDRGLIEEHLRDIARDVDRDTFDGSLLIDSETLEVDFEPAHGSAVTRVDDAIDLTRAALFESGTETIELPVDLTQARVDPDALQIVAERARGALRSPITLHHGEETLTLSPSDIAQLMDLERSRSEDRTEVAIVVTPFRVDRLVEPQTAERFLTEPVDAAYTTPREPPVTLDDQGSTSFQPIDVEVGIDPSRPGTRFDPRITADQLTQMIRAGLSDAQLWLATIEPQLPTQRLAELRPTHLLGTFTTYHQAGQSRVHNIQRLADTIDGTILLPGEQFSINGISGRRTCGEGGYLPAGTIVRGELVDTCGGGTSQFATTTYNAAFFSGVQIDRWKAHSWYISRYPMGREATLNYPELDVRFTNDTEGALLVRTSHTPTSITVSILGQPIAREVRATLGNPTNPRSPSTQVRQTSDLFVGQERVLQSAGSGGFTVRVVRTIERLDGRTVTENIDTVYVPQHRIVERGTRPRPPVEDDEPDDE